MREKCPFCQAKILKSLAQTEDRTIYKCLCCGLVSAASEIINGQLSPKAKARLRTTDYQKGGKKWFQEYLAEKPSYLSRFKKRFFEIEKRKKPGRILDVGCATGILLKLAQSHGWQIFWVDISPKAIKYCHQTFDFDRVFCGTLKQARFKTQFFDVIAVFDTLEHMPDIRSFLAEVNRVLKSDGLLAITVPNQAGLLCKLLGKSWFDYKRLQHLYFFTPKTLKMVLEKTGFRTILEKKEPFLPGTVRSAFTKLKRYYPNFLVNQSLFIAEKLAKLFKIKSVGLPLEHIYVIAKKN